MYHLNELNELEQAIQLSPDNVPIRLMLIRKLEPLTEYIENLEFHVKEILTRNAKHVEGRNLLARVYYTKENLSACIILCEELLTLDNLDSRNHLNLAKCYLKEGNHPRSQQIYQKSLLSNPNMTDVKLDNAFRMKTNFDDDSRIGDDAFLEKPDIDFSDVGGMDNVKREIELKIIKPLSHADLYAQYGKKVGGGILLYGPPGCGKTYLARATAGEIKSKFITVGLNDILDMWVGSSEKNLNQIFETARANSPCVLFVDEIDALGAKRSDLKMSAGKNVINQFLAELDGVSASNEGVLVIGATNSPWHLDSAFRRPGRFDRIIFVPPPDVSSKVEILKLVLKEKPIGTIDYKRLAQQTKNYSGADLNAIVDIAIEKKLEKAMDTGVSEVLETKDLLQALLEHRASTVDWFTSAKNYALFANQSGLYDPVLDYLKMK